MNVDRQIMQKGGLMALSELRSLVSEMMEERVAQVRVVNNGKGKTQRKNRQTRMKMEKKTNNNKPESTSLLFSNSLEIPLVDFLLSTTFLFTVMKILSTILLAPGVHPTSLLSIIMYSHEASSPSKSFAPEQTRKVVRLFSVSCSLPSSFVMDFSIYP